MSVFQINENIKKIFIPNRKCIINADLDGILSGMLLQHFLNWDVVGYSSCCGKPDDELWLKDKYEDLKECVFVDLPVCTPELSVIDQHFVAFDYKSINKYNSELNKVNPNVMRKKVFKNENSRCEYTQKYPFGTVHFILAVLENLKIIDEKYVFNFKKKIDNFDLADLFLRADRVIGNTYSYTPNCFDWANWIMDIGGKNTKDLFVVVKNEYSQRKFIESKVEFKLKSLGCIGGDGDCSNLFRNKSDLLLKQYFQFLSECLEVKPLPLFKYFEFSKLKGRRFEVSTYNLDVIKNECMKDNVFSFAFVTMRALSLTYLED